MRKSACLLPLALRITSQFASVQLIEPQGVFLSLGTGCRVPHLLSASKPLLRSILSKTHNGEADSSNEEDAVDDSFKEKVRKIASVIQVQQDLKHEAEFHDSIPSEKLLQLILDRGAARDKVEAGELVTAMQHAGVMLLHNNQVYLKPIELVEHRLPDFLRAEDLKARVEEIDRALQPYEEINRIAEKKAWGLLYVGCFVLAIQLAAFLRLTYYELSWDVMEPVGYIISLFYTLLGYFFFIYTKGHPFDLQPVKEWYTRRLKRARAASTGGVEMDDERYEALVKAKGRYSKRLQFLQKMESKHTTGAT